MKFLIVILMWLGDFTYDIQFKTDNKTYQLKVLESGVIKKNVFSLADTATIVVPETMNNNVITGIERIKRGSEVSISIGYNGNNKQEFKGWALSVQKSNGGVVIECEDDLFLFRKAVKDKVFKNTTMKEIAQYVCNDLGLNYKVDVDTYNIGYEKFTIYKATGYDVLKKLSEETRANIWLSNNTLYIHSPYTLKTGEADFSMQHNIMEGSRLEFQKKEDYKCLVTVQRIGSDGKIHEEKSGEPGGDSFTIKVGTIAASSLKTIADNERILRSKNGLKGAFDTWLITRVQPGYTLKLSDDEYPNEKGNYYCTAVDYIFNQSEVKQTITPEARLG